MDSKKILLIFCLFFGLCLGIFFINRKGDNKSIVFMFPPTDFNPTVEVAGCHCLYKNKFLLLKRCSHKPQGNTWGHPAGKLNPEENPLVGLIREVKEETNLDLSNNKPKLVKTVYVRYPAFDFVYHIFMKEFDKLPNDIKLHKNEHQAFKWVTKEEALAMDLAPGEKECIELLMQSIDHSKTLKKSAKKKVRNTDVNWESEYKSSNENLWEQKPHTFSQDAFSYIQTGKVLDLGAGEGYDCMYFAKKGFKVTALDISSTAIDKLLKKAANSDLSINGIVSDINKFYAESCYDIILSYGTLQFLGQNFNGYISNLKDKTNSGGLHVFYIFGNKGDFYSLAHKKFYFPSEKELLQMYSDWKIIKFEQKNTKLLIKGDKGEALYNLMFKILAQKNT